MEKVQGKNKRQEQKQNQNQNQNQKNLQANNKALVWDCGSSLYDSFELKSFERQLDSAISSRTLSMPHFPDRQVLTPPPPPPKKLSKISRSLNKFLKSMFKSKQNSSTMFRVQERLQDEYYVIYDKSGALTTIPEVPEIDFGGFSPEINSLVRKTVSDRFTAASIGRFYGAASLLLSVDGAEGREDRSVAEAERGLCGRGGCWVMRVLSAERKRLLRRGTAALAGLWKWEEESRPKEESRL
ncbi:hypothetical protein POTOM_004293 [Populus tomentosa]|uniref:Uncharacterized protein n=1 Tax=Populus tomentosa TaxID=118781 RepID=A0A8X8AH28_POPTO|nr:hypothetical protein POTOM_004293 [Populus tomentosa]